MNKDKEAEEEYFSQPEYVYTNKNELWGDVWEK